MMEDIHIPDGTAVKLLLAGLVLASGAVGALGLVHGTSQAAVTGPVDDSSAQLAFPIDNFSAAFPIDNFSAASPIDNFSAAFPIDNFSAASPIDGASVGGSSRDVTGTDPSRATGIGSTGANVLAFARIEAPEELPQDMDPY